MGYKVTVIIPIYNNENEFKRTMDSLLSQTFGTGNFEVIVVDDGSKIKMEGFVSEYADRMPVRYFYLEDKGFCPGSARNIGIKKADGELCLFIDSGVVLERSCLEEHFRLHREGSGEIVVVGYVYGNDIHSDLQEMRDIMDNHNPEESIEIMTGRKMIDGREGLYQELGDDLSVWPAPWVVLWSLHFSAPTKFLRTHGILFDEYFNTWGCEDNDFGIQLHKNGAVFTLGRNAKAVHYPASVRSYDRLKNEAEFKSNFRNNQLYVANKYGDDKGVALWYEKGMFQVNRVLLEENGTKE